jgi:hypothetical protein
MAATFDLYLRDQVIRGELRPETSLRPIDLLNGAKSSLLVIQNGVSHSLHAKAPAVKLGTVRVQRTHSLVIVPAELAPLSSRQVRIGYVEKRQVRAHVGLGHCW